MDSGFYRSNQREGFHPRRFDRASRAGLRGTYLDQLAVVPRAAWGLTKVCATGVQAIRVRRSSDNDELDINFNGRLLDTTALLDFCGAGSGYAHTVYDQTGNGEDFVQTTASKQPRIVNAGVYDGLITPDGADDFMVCSSLTLGTPQFGLYLRAKKASFAGSQQIFFETSTIYSSANTASVSKSSGALYCLANNGAGNNYRQNYFTVAAMAALENLTVLMDRSLAGTGEIACWQAGAEFSPNNAGLTEQTGNFASYDAYLFSRAGTSLFNDSPMQGWAVYNSDSAAYRAEIEAILARTS